MAHCYICDFSETVTSDYYGALEVVDPVGNVVVYDDKIDQYICTDCIGASLANFRALVSQYKPPKLEFDELTFDLEIIDDELSSTPPWDFEGLESPIRNAVLEED